ncbi:hypothetical protein Pelo_18780 [Pelomyxa schiedti]|nr:hypothetical protein Pelo_18780 [Pelomyxa schiedti]
MGNKGQKRKAPYYEKTNLISNCVTSSTTYTEAYRTLLVGGLSSHSMQTDDEGKAGDTVDVVDAAVHPGRVVPPAVVVVDDLDDAKEAEDDVALETMRSNMAC